jgi:hypothetical protein
MYSGDETKVQNFIGKPERKRAFGRPRNRSEDNIEMDIWPKEIGLDCLDWIHVQDRDRWRAFVNTVMNLPVA